MNAAQTASSTINGLRVAQTILQPSSALHQPILMLHGWGADRSLMLPLAEKLAPLGYPLYIPDLPGFGESDPPPQAWTVSDYAQFTLAYMNAHDLKRVFLFGHSFGGRISLYLGAEQPARVIKLALANSAGVPPKRSLAAQMRLNVYKGVRGGLYRIGARGVADGLRAWYTRRYGSADFRAVDGVMRETLVQVVSENMLPYARRVRASTLLFWGENDEDTPLWMGQTLERTIPDAGLITFPNVGHYSYLERLADVTRIVDHFFRG